MLQAENKPQRHHVDHCHLALLNKAEEQLRNAGRSVNHPNMLPAPTQPTPSCCHCTTHKPAALQRPDSHTPAPNSHHNRQQQYSTGAAVSALRCCCCRRRLCCATAHAATCSGLLALASTLAAAPRMLLDCCNRLLRSTCGARWMGRSRRTRTWRSTFAGRCSGWPGWSHRSIQSTCAPVGPPP